MLVVKRPFRNFGKTLEVGTVITDTNSIKRFKTRLAEGKIIEVNEDNFKANAKYFKSKYGIILPKMSDDTPVEVTHSETPAVIVAKAIAVK